jgi:hypothetical protein
VIEPHHSIRALPQRGLRLCGMGAALTLSACAPSEDWSSTLEAVAGEGGVAVLLERQPPEGARLWRGGGEGPEAVLPADGPTLVDPAGGPGSCYALRRRGGLLAEGCASAAVGATGFSPSPALALAGESLHVTLAIQPLEAPLALERGPWVVRRSRDDGLQERWLDPYCLGDDALDEGCWLDEPTVIPHDALGDASAPVLELPPYAPQASRPPRGPPTRRTRCSRAAP